MAAPDRDDEPEQIELPPSKRTLLGRLAHWVEHAQALKGLVQEARRDSPALDATFETIERDSHIGGGMLAGALSYRLFIFALPLAFFLVSGLGLVAQALGVEPNVVANSVGIAGTVTKQVQGAAKGSSNWWVAVASLLRARLHDESPAPIGGDRPRTCLGRLGRLGQGARSPARDLRRSDRRPAPARRRPRRRRSPDGDRRRRRAGRLRGRPRRALARRRPPPAALRRPLDRPDPRILFYAIGIVAVQIFNVLILGQMIKEKSTTYGALGIAAAISSTSS